MDTTVASTSAEPADVKIPGLLVAEEAATHPQPSPPRVDPPRPHSAGAQLPETRQGKKSLIGFDIVIFGDSADMCRDAVPPLRTNPALTQNILSLYGLDPLVATVARTDPATGEKINKMRKSYEGQLKSLGLAGRNKAVKHDDTKGMGLSEMAAWPEEEWQNQKVMGKDVTKGVSETMMGKLGKAMQLQPGKVPDNDYWEDLLGIDKVKPNDLNVKGVKSTTGTKASGPQLNGARAPTATTASANASQPAEPIRARRTTKKRRYDDGSFEGYGEGYADDDMDPGYSSGESRSTKNSAGHRKRRKTKV